MSTEILWTMGQGGDMIRILIHKGAHVFNPSKELMQKIHNDLTFENPKYKNAVRYGAGSHLYLEKYISFYSYNESKNVAYVPRGYVFYLVKYLKLNNIPWETTDNTTLRQQVAFDFKGTPREYQKKAVEGAMRYPVGVIESGTGSGKTFMGINMIALRKQPTLVLVHTKELLYQWEERIQQYLGIQCGMVGDGKYKLGEVTVGIVQSVQNRIDELKDTFGHIIVDEVHRCPAATWTDVLSQFTAKYFLGLSATAYRNDGLGKAIHAFIGPKIHVVDSEVLHSSGAVLKPRIFRIPTGYHVFYTGEFTHLISDLVCNEERNKLIAKTVQSDILQFNSQVLIASDRVNHCLDIQEQLERLKLSSVVLTASTNRRDRKDIVAGMASGQYKILISTVQLIGEGFDAPGIHALFMATPLKYKGRVIQIAGRVLRPEEGKIARIYDFRDDSISVLRNMGIQRDKTYKKAWG